MSRYNSYLAAHKIYQQRGFTLIELMISLLLGILVVIAVTSVFISGKQAHSTTQGLNRIQENQRMVFEMMASDIRSAGSYTCPGMVDPVWQVGTNGEDWPETRYMLAVGLEGNSPLVSKDGEKHDTGKDLDSITLSMDAAIDGLGGSAELHYYPVNKHRAPDDDLILEGRDSADTFKKNAQGNYWVVCNIDTAIVFGADELSGQTIKINSGAGANNLCGKYFSRDPSDITDCSAEEPAKGYCFLGNLTQELSEAEKQVCGEWSSSQAFVVSLADYRPAYTQKNPNPYATSWYVDIVEEEENGIKRKKHFLVNPARGGRMVEGVSSLQLRYRIRGTDKYITAEELQRASPAFDFKRQGVGSIQIPTSHKYASDWAKVDSVYLKMTFQSPDGVKGVDGNELERTLETYIAVRSHILEY